ncbi:6-phosphogluconate dehydrogenase (decarboxylating) [Candidatus Curtissbacteria bacterium RIFCSPHIGHO2_01_FULL_41_44]|uniref:6-phosphogluconate dehydrogenase (Decarboxylating) n=1 Tax=Candidatus Curtissbacteria bacterium RIFCSPLOWO2_01_FULL_42_50 TaxID=1797730 RepID=A0A1F5H327_9BACT|nr:MAG: 6-phosphogluconate dehydrogenase (decarboxylating) [Candidatus Curtissbacteria bacterium RIFCSPHIGHO2_01_FULL_41_44]OGD92891.1 MAG: 6-phosphogluconate dehydrogenase (decarboxylating) [Candidatus Curtissbacteria bacterium RIFCSPHIGHO2_02_FULL_42_58]OGD96623.1 MAG: 6-phosphogluconate dehydrogenase (decarboxylating) [Candidatus Curtissbacteria bacterium RIFCSPHIGHO2_12_FULL_42_33]OGD98533.1 MAG: 6-phosphogluconate dehydrogenase (decarboxylating) [Candidatus Curtissbacteria bacterium RIFCSPL
MQLGLIGLGRMGSNMVMKLLSEGHEVVVWNRSAEKIENLKLKSENFGSRKNLKAADSVQNLVKELKSPRVVWSMLPAGEPTEEILMGPEGVADWVEEGDIVIDGGNSYFEDTQRRYEYFTNKGILFLGIGVSGGIIAAKDGYPMMVGGSVEGYELIKPVLESLAKPNGGHEYFGEGGAGHFVKMVHNGIEYGYMQAIGEGFGVLEKSPYDLDLVKAAKLYTKGTLLSGFMMDRTVEALENDPKLERIEGYIAASGEGEWTVRQGKYENVPVEIIEASLDYRTRSREDKKVSSSFAARMVAALRNAFGGHEVKKRWKPEV